MCMMFSTRVADLTFLSRVFVGCAWWLALATQTPDPEQKQVITISYIVSVDSWSDWNSGSRPQPNEKPVFRQKYSHHRNYSEEQVEGQA